MHVKTMIHVFLTLSVALVMILMLTLAVGLILMLTKTVVLIMSASWFTSLMMVLTPRASSGEHGTSQLLWWFLPGPCHCLRTPTPLSS